jgi:CheY-like chemotaxis protein
MAKILYVEDNDDNTFILYRRLTSAGFEVLLARDGEEGIAMAIANLPDLIVMDLDLPVVDGWEATRRLKGRPDTGRIPIIALTAHSEPSSRAEAMAAGCDAFEEKPVNFAGLVARINTVLGGLGRP